MVYAPPGFGYVDECFSKLIWYGIAVSRCQGRATIVWAQNYEGISMDWRAVDVGSGPSNLLSL